MPEVFLSGSAGREQASSSKLDAIENPADTA